jgi:hypothetical protein
VPISWVFWILLVPVQALMLAGYVSGLRRSGEDILEDQPNWARSIYPAGLVLPLLSGLSLGLFGWEGARQIGVLPVALVASLLGGALGWFFWQIPGLRRAVQPAVRSGERLASGSAYIFQAASAVTWGIYQTLGRFGSAVARTLEGDGGLLWTMVILVLFFSIFQTFLR